MSLVLGGDRVYGIGREVFHSVSALLRDHWVPKPVGYWSNGGGGGMGIARRLRIFFVGILGEWAFRVYGGMVPDIVPALPVDCSLVREFVHLGGILLLIKYVRIRGLFM